MSIKRIGTCDGCGKTLAGDDMIYCEGCYSKLGGGLAGCAERVKGLEDKITELKQDLLIARREGK